MKTLYTIGEAAEKVGVTSETLRHYDRINLVKPSVTDKQTSYRYYTNNDIVLLRTVYALRMLELPLSLIKEVMNYDNLDKVIEFMAEAEKKANELRQQALTPAILEKMWIEKWDGKLPVYGQVPTIFKDISK